MFAGPNGSGKTSLVERFSRERAANGLFHLNYFINADEIQDFLTSGTPIALDFLSNQVDGERLRESLTTGGRLPLDHPFIQNVQVAGQRLTAPSAAVDGYVAAAVADFFREEMLRNGQSFSFETVMSHPSKVQFLARSKLLGYRPYLYFVATDSPQLNVLRVRTRFSLGGHFVPEKKIIERYNRCLNLLPQALSHSYRAFIFDNSGDEPVWLAELLPSHGLQLKVSRDLMPQWFIKAVLPVYPDSRLG